MLEAILMISTVFVLFVLFVLRFTRNWRACRALNARIMERTSALGLNADGTKIVPHKLQLLNELELREIMEPQKLLPRWLGTSKLEDLTETEARLMSGMARRTARVIRIVADIALVVAGLGLGKLLVPALEQGPGHSSFPFYGWSYFWFIVFGAIAAVAMLSKSEADEYLEASSVFHNHAKRERMTLRPPPSGRGHRH